MGRALACLVAAGLAWALASCTPSATTDPTDTPTATDAPTTTPTNTATADPTLPPNAAMDVLDASGQFGDTPELTVPAPWTIDSTSTKILVQGFGPQVASAGMVRVNYTGFNGRTGESFDSSFERGKPESFSMTQVVAGFQKGLDGQRVGTRLIIAMPGADGYDASTNRPEGIEVGDTLIFVVDILQAGVTEPQGVAQVVDDPSLPTVSGTLDMPVLTIPSVDPPTELVVEQLIRGNGPEVAAGDRLVAQYTEYVWSTGQRVRMTYGYSPLFGTMTDIIPGWQTALLGQPQGSRLLLVVPPDQAYPDGNAKIGVPAGSTMAYVVDILFTAAP
jgi:peptidylprolyl isomerase